MTQHYNKAKDLVNKGLTSDSFAKHAATCFPAESKIAANDVRTGFNVEILWHGNPISCNKSFGRLTCSLCMKERLEIMKAIREEPGRLINLKNESYGARRHKPRFHRYTKTIPPSADEGQKSRKR